MGVLKLRRAMRRLRERAEADPAIRAVWIKCHDALFVGAQVGGFGPNSHDPSCWVDIVGSIGDRPPNRQELEWWKAMCMGRLAAPCPREWEVVIGATVQAITSMFADAAVGPSDERYAW